MLVEASGLCRLAKGDLMATFCLSWDEMNDESDDIALSHEALVDSQVQSRKYTPVRCYHSIMFVLMSIRIAADTASLGIKLSLIIVFLLLLTIANLYCTQSLVGTPMKASKY